MSHAKETKFVVVEVSTVVSPSTSVLMAALSYMKSASARTTQSFSSLQFNVTYFTSQYSRDSLRVVGRSRIF